MVSHIADDKIFIINGSQNNKMNNDIRTYNYCDESPLISRIRQIKKYLDKKFSDIKVDVDFTDVEQKITDSTSEIKETINTSSSDIKDTITESTDGIKETISESTAELKETINTSTSDIKEAIEDAKPCFCNLATKEDVTEAKNEIIKEIDEKFVDLNELIKQ